MSATYRMKGEPCPLSEDQGETAEDRGKGRDAEGRFGKETAFQLLTLRAGLAESWEFFQEALNFIISLHLYNKCN